MEKKTFKHRIYFALSIFLLGFVLILAKALKLQVIDKEELISRSKSQFLRERKVYPKRGIIYDRNKNPLALNIQTYSIFTIPKNLKADKTSYRKLSKVVKTLTYNNILKKIKGRERYTWLARKISLTKEQAKIIKKIPGIYIETVPKRIYPNHELLSQTLGFVGIDNIGLSGLEYSYDKELKGEPRNIRYIKDAKGRAIKMESSKIEGPSSELVLTIDKDLQAIAEKALRDAVVDSGGKKGGVGVMDARTGEILAVANYPTYDPNSLKRAQKDFRKLSFVSDPFEPGSTFKVFTVASALENKIARIDTNYYCERGQLKVGDHVITEAESRKKYEWLSVEEIIMYSSNIGTTKMAFDLTYPRLNETLRDFGFGKKTGVQLPGESRGIYNENENVSPLTLSNISFGQGVAVTGVQMLSAYSALANGGYYLPPTIIKDANKDVKPKRIIEKSTADQITNILIRAVEDGTGSEAKIPYFKIAGKTSTAQKASESGGYKGYIPGFIGYPVNIKNPFVIFAYVDEPNEKRYYGNQIAAPIFRKIAEYMLYKTKEFDQMAIKKTKSNSEIDKVTFKQSSAKRFVSKALVPNFIGLDKKSSQKLASKMNIKVIPTGMGVVSSQVPEAGTAVNDSTEITLKFSPPEYE
ncbi:MAG: cell division protein FtsI (penicillin-binding protein 3) [Bacteriovoracaceae bacterium]|jgi:cell division protein FtsI (penicillin-binding protein 3)